MDVQLKKTPLAENISVVLAVFLKLCVFPLTDSFLLLLSRVLSDLDDRKCASRRCNVVYKGCCHGGRVFLPIYRE